MFEFLLILIFPGAMVLAAVSDLVTMTISNWISIVLAAGFAVLAVWAGLGWSDVGLHVLVGFIALAAGFTCFAFNWIGGGDAKLFAAISLWLGWPDVLSYVLLASIFGGMFTVALLALNHIPLPAGLTRHAWIARLHTLKDGVPYGFALAAAGLVVYPHSIWMTSILGKF
jgi:prepilin peptidase CpaA